MPENLHIFVNGHPYGADDGVKEFMSGTEIAALAGVRASRTLVSLSSTTELIVATYVLTRSIPTSKR